MGTQGISYSCIKAALEMLTKIMAITLGPHKIRVNAVCPGLVETDMMTQGLKEINSNGKECEFQKVWEQQTPSGQVVMPMNDVVNTILFMASDSTTQMTGQCLGVDGGSSAV